MRYILYMWYTYFLSGCIFIYYSHVEILHMAEFGLKDIIIGNICHMNNILLIL